MRLNAVLGVVRLNSVLVALSDCFPPTAVSSPLTTAMEKYLLEHSGTMVHCLVSELYINILVQLTQSAK